MNFKLILFILISFGISSTSFSQDYETYNSGSNNCLTIKIPTTWTIYDDDWNNYMKKTFSPESQRVTIIRASDYDISTFYFKISYINMGKKYKKEEISSDNFDLLNNYNASLLDVIKQLKSSGNTIISNKKSEFVSIDKAYGCYYSYTYTNSNEQTRTSEIYYVIVGQTGYFITISWNVENSSKPETIKSKLISNLKLCDLFN
ncbi:MAG: hypothetical protein FGM14_00550 [Flavobacteriales bacterium]|nr:hypothetical protein [Flavobacteriales bacterium]